VLYGLEAMQLMQNGVSSPESNRRSTPNAFIDATGFGNTASHCDDRYEVAYLELEGDPTRSALSQLWGRPERPARFCPVEGWGRMQGLLIVPALRASSRSWNQKSSGTPRPNN
jgi:hypothetical protein